MKITRLATAALLALMVASCDGAQRGRRHRNDSVGPHLRELRVVLGRNRLRLHGGERRRPVRRSELGHQVYMNLSTATGYTHLNNTIRSIRTGAWVRGKICADPGGHGNCGYLMPNTTYADLLFGQGCPGGLVNYGFGGRCMNSISSFRVDLDYSCSSPGPGQVSIFQDGNFNNNMVRPSVNTPDCVTLNAGGSLHYPNAAWNATSGQTGRLRPQR